MSWAEPWAQLVLCSQTSPQILTEKHILAQASGYVVSNWPDSSGQKGRQSDPSGWSAAAHVDMPLESLKPFGTRVQSGFCLATFCWEIKCVGAPVLLAVT